MLDVPASVVAVKAAPSGDRAKTVPAPPPARSGDDATAPPQAAVSGNKVLYAQSYFARYNVQNAEDMLRRIPGVSAILDAAGTTTQTRGFGSGGDQVLVAGRRFPGKSNEITKILRRLRASSIERIELIRGASDDIDVQSTGVVVNLILKPGATLGGGGNYELNARFNDAARFGIDGLLNYAGSTGRLGYSAGIEHNLWSPASVGMARWTNRSRAEAYYYPAGQLQELRPQQWSRLHDKWVATGGLTYDFPGGARAQLNGLYERRKVRETDVTPLIRYAISGAETLRATEQHVRDSDTVKTLEIGGEYRTTIGKGELTALFILTRVDTPTGDFRTRQEPTRLVEVSRNFTAVKQAEDIARAGYSFPLGRRMTLEVGGEVSRNSLVQQLDAFFDLDGDGKLEAITVPTAYATVRELRGEGYLNHRWTVTPKLSVNSSLNFEYSKLTTNSAFNPGRTLRYLKPRIDLRYQVGTGGQARALVERTVSQLDFLNFVPAYNVLDDRVEAGNPGLLPERTWNYELGYEQRLAKDAGTLSARAFYKDITNPIDRYPLRQGGVLVSAQGNADRGTLYGTELKGSVRLIPLGVRDAVLTGRVLWQGSDVRDPFTGLPRRLRSDRGYAYDIGFRHDVTRLKLSYGFDYKNTGGFSTISDLFSRDLFRIAPLLEAFAERKLTRSMVLRMEAQNVLGSHEYRLRTQYAVNQIVGTVRRLDRYEEVRDVRFAVRLRGTF